MKAYSIGRLAKAAGCSVSTVRYWERLGRIRALSRLDDRQHRRYSAQQLVELRALLTAHKAMNPTITPYLLLSGLRLRHVVQLTGLPERRVRTHACNGILTTATRSGARNERVFTARDVYEYMQRLDMDTTALEMMLDAAAATAAKLAEPPTRNPFAGMSGANIRFERHAS